MTGVTLQTDVRTDGWPDGRTVGKIIISPAFSSKTAGIKLLGLLCCSSSFFVLRWLYTLCLFCSTYLPLILFPLRGQCFVIVAFPGYLHLYVYTFQAHKHYTFRLYQKVCEALSFCVVNIYSIIPTNSVQIVCTPAPFWLQISFWMLQKRLYLVPF